MRLKMIYLRNLLGYPSTDATKTKDKHITTMSL